MAILCWILGHDEVPGEVLEPGSRTDRYPATMVCLRCDRERIIEVPTELLLGDSRERSRPGPWEIYRCEGCGQQRPLIGRGASALKFCPACDGD